MQQQGSTQLHLTVQQARAQPVQRIKLVDASADMVWTLLGLSCALLGWFHASVLVTALKP
jgi:hypothetical protein